MKPEKNKRPELMSPVKNISGVVACAEYSDAIYFGVSEFNLRANSKGITLESLNQFVSFCHQKNLKAYLTVNCTFYNNDIEKVEKVIEKAKEAKVDAVIIWDPAAIEIAKKNKIDFFISTQANLSNYKSVKFYKDLGAKRVILAREMTLNQIKEIKEKVDIEIETFIHGAVCLAISGRCILSGFYDNCSANKGSCKQPCRRNWKLVDDNGNLLETEGKYYLSPKDICMIEHIPEMIEAGIDSFKIEGRQRDSKYIKETAKHYRKAINSYFDGSFNKEKAKKWKENLKKVYNRQFSTGFYFGTPTKEGINFEVSGNAGSIKKLQIGIVTHYFSRNKVASVNLLHRDLSLGDIVIFEGETTYLEKRISSLEVNSKSLKKAIKGQEVGVKVSEKVRKNDKVFLLTD